MQQNHMVSPVLCHIQYVIRPSSDHAEVGCSFEFTSDKVLITCPGYMLSRGTIGGSPSALLFLHSFSSPSGCTFRSVSPCDPVSHPLSTLKTIFGVIPISTAMALPDLHLYEFRICLFEPWRTGETIYTASTVIYGAILAAVGHTYPSCQPLLR